MKKIIIGIIITISLISVSFSLNRIGGIPTDSFPEAELSLD